MDILAAARRFMFESRERWIERMIAADEARASDGAAPLLRRGRTKREPGASVGRTEGSVGSPAND